MIQVDRTTVDKPADRLAWLDARAPYFNASSTAILFDRHPFQTAGDYATEKLTGQDREVESKAMIRGRRLEPVIASWYAEDTGTTLIEPTEMYVAGPVMATVDRRQIDGPERIIEIKTTRGYVSEPETYWLDQCQAIMLCTGEDEIDLVWYDATLELQSLVIVADETWQSAILSAADRFMAAIELGIVPDIAEGNLSAGNVTDLFPHPEGERPLDDTDMGLVIRYAQLRSERKRLDDEMDGLKDRLAEVMADKEVATYGGVDVLTYKATKPAVRLDVKALRKDYPDLASEYSTVGAATRRMVVKYGDEEGAA